MTLRRLIALLLPLTLAIPSHSQTDLCAPEPFPYVETFNSGFVHDNGHAESFGDYTYQENDNCWTVCWVRSWGWRSLLSLWGSQNRKVMMLRANAYQEGSPRKAYMPYAVSPRMATAPRRLQFKASYQCTDWYPWNPLHLDEGAWLALGYVTNESDCINSYVPFDTIRVMADWEEEEAIQSFDIDLGRYFDTFPQPWRIAFRPERQEDIYDVIMLVDDVRISDEVPEYHCTESYTDTICSGSGYYRHGFRILPGQTFLVGTRHYSYVDTTGCLVNLGLTVTGTHTTVVVDTVPCGQPSRYAPDTVLTAGTHYFYLSDRHGCDSLVVLTIHQAWVTHLYDTIQEGDSLLFEGQTLTAGGIYTHDTVASDGCDSLVVMHLRCQPLPAVNTDTLVFWFPNVFTPGRDDNNRFGCITTCEVKEFELDIYTHMGLMVYSTHDIHAPWDGTHRGRPVPQGAYVYHYRIRMADMRVRTGAGTVTLLR